MTLTVGKRPPPPNLVIPFVATQVPALTNTAPNVIKQYIVVSVECVNFCCFSVVGCFAGVTLIRSC